MCQFNSGCPGHQDSDGMFWPCQSHSDCPASSCRFAIVTEGFADGNLYRTDTVQMEFSSDEEANEFCREHSRGDQFSGFILRVQ